jgi:hypothetical protein
MKKLTIVLIVLITIFSGSIVFAQTDKDFEAHIVKSEKIESTILQKVFPGVDFFIQTSNITIPVAKRVVGNINNEVFIMPEKYNTLFKKIENISPASHEERIDAFVKLFFSQDGDISWLKDKSTRHLSIMSKLVNQKRGISNYQVEVDKNGSRQQFLIRFQKNQIKRVEIYLDGLRQGIITPTSSFLETQDVNISISGINPIPIGGRDHYYIVVSNNGTATNNNVTFNVSGLSPSQQNVFLQVQPVYWTDNSTYFLNQVISVNGSGNATFTWTPPNNDHTGICIIQVDTGGTIQPIIPMSNAWIIPEKILTGTFNNGGQVNPVWTDSIYYCDQFFINHDNHITHALTFANMVRDALNDSWDREVLDWSLCQGIANNRPVDGNNNYQVFINDSRDGQTVYKYHSVHSGTDAFPWGDRIIEIGSRLHQWTEAHMDVYQPEQDLIRSAVCHEFYHGIEFSHNTGSVTGDWMIEGQARFIQTVFMSQYSNPGEEYEGGRMFQGDANDFLLDNLNTSLDNLAYNYCIFWRFLYENYSTGSVANKLSIIRETCRGNTSSAIADIESFMDSKLNGTYNSMDDAIKEFAKRAYFNDPTYSFWNPCPSDAFYERPKITGDADNDGITYTYDGSNGTPINDAIPNPFGIDYLVFGFDSKLEKATINFDGDPNSNKDMAEFNVKIFLLNGNTIESENEITLTDGKGHFDVNINKRSNIKAVLVMTRLDVNESSENDYKVYFDGVDIALVIDRSGSMVGTKIASAKTAASTFVGFMQRGDNIAVVNFDDVVEVSYPLTLISSDAIKTAAQSAINALYARNNTSIGGGIAAGQRELNKGNTQISQAMVLLSDGLENTAPWVAPVLATIPDKTDIYTIALGSDADRVLLNDIAVHTGGLFSFASDASRLQFLYNTIHAKITKQQTIANSSGSVSQGQTQSQTAQLDGSVSYATFSITWPGSDLDLTLVDPNGRIIDPDTVIVDPNITFTSGATYEFYNVNNPVPGLWTLKITGVNTPAGSEAYSALVTGTATLQMEVNFDKAAYGVGDSILVSANINESSTPITGATVVADVQIPTQAAAEAVRNSRALHADKESDAASEMNSKVSTTNTSGENQKQNEIQYYATTTISLYDDGAHGDGAAGDGIYANYFKETRNEGGYTFNVKANGTSPTSGAFTREDTRSTVVTLMQTITVTTPRTGKIWQVGNTETLNWSSTNITENVNIKLSIDGGLSYPINLALDTPNDGVEQITVPNDTSSQCRIKVEWTSNPSIVFGLNPGFFAIIPKAGSPTLSLPVVQGFNALSWNIQPEDGFITSVFSKLLTADKVQVILEYINDGVTAPHFSFHIPE